ncbi:hypothetical protein BN903_18 [Halorubrum sp. AJ67]|nr:hypothetical protein BN903_18 [Halorubrum sp. AJ67]
MDAFDCSAMRMNSLRKSMTLAHQKTSERYEGQMDRRTIIKSIYYLIYQKNIINSVPSYPQIDTWIPTDRIRNAQQTRRVVYFLIGCFPLGVTRNALTVRVGP